MKRLFLLLLLVVLLPLSCQKDEVGPTSDCTVEDHSGYPNAALYQILLDDYTRKGLPGISMLVRDKNGTWAEASGMADIDRNIPMRACHVSKVASITKLFIGTLALQLEDTFLEFRAKMVDLIMLK